MVKVVHGGQCGHCGTIVPTGFNTCAGCGATWKMTASAADGRRFLLGLLLAIGGVGACIVVVVSGARGFELLQAVFVFGAAAALGVGLMRKANTAAGRHAWMR